MTNIVPQIVGLVLLLSSAAYGSDVLSVTILSQDSTFDQRLARSLQDNIKNQLGPVNVDIVTTFSGDTPQYGFWAIWPVCKRLLASVGGDWFVFVEPKSRVDIAKLTSFLEWQNPEESVYFGYGLQDETLSIIHHFYGHDRPAGQSALLYPDFAAGVVFSKGLMERLVKSLEVKSLFNQFVIDPQHELSRYLFDHLSVILSSHQDVFCLKHNKGCVISVEEFPYDTCTPQLSAHNVHVAVKTFSGNHRTRLVVLKRTWSRDMPKIEYISDVEDPFVPTISVGVNNTERGHCGKTFAILRRFLEQKFDGSVDWLVVADDDTLLSVPRLLKLLSCYDPKEKLIIGERYGFGFSADTVSGYDYPTGGSGMVFSRVAVEALLEKCDCPSPDSPDDMIIGMCARSTAVRIIHNTAFHQARRMDYATDYVSKVKPISFHKFEGIDPYADYMNHLNEDSGGQNHEEL